MAEGMKRVFQTKITDVSTTDKEGVGTVRREGDNKYLYCKGLAGTAQYDIMVINADYTTAAPAAATANTYRVGVAQAAIVADHYGWYQIMGHGTIAGASDLAANAPLYLNASKQATATAGTNPRLHGIVVTNASTKTAFILNPYTAEDLDTTA
jgi:hypothetical protein